MENETVAGRNRSRKYPPHPKGEAGLLDPGSGEGMCPRMLRGTTTVLVTDRSRVDTYWSQKTSGETTRRGAEREDRKACWGWRGGGGGGPQLPSKGFP